MYSPIRHIKNISPALFHFPQGLVAKKSARNQTTLLISTKHPEQGHPVKVEVSMAREAGRAQLAERATGKPRCNTDTGSSLRCDTGCFSQSQLPVQTLLRCPYSPRVQPRALTCVLMLKIPNTGSLTIIWTLTREYCTH